MGVGPRSGTSKVRDNSPRRREVRGLFANKLPEYIRAEVERIKGERYAMIFAAYVDGDKTCMEISELCNVEMGHVSFAVGECLKIARRMQHVSESNASGAGSAGSVDDGSGVISSGAAAGTRNRGD